MRVQSARNVASFITKGAGRWVPRTEGAVEALCAACRRINDKFPAGVVALRGDFVREHKEEMIHVARHQEDAEKNEHPLNRIISIEEDAQGLVINTTDIHLPRRIGEAIKRAFRGEIEDNFEKDGYFRAGKLDPGSLKRPGMHCPIVSNRLFNDRSSAPLAELRHLLIRRRTFRWLGRHSSSHGKAPLSREGR